MNNKQVMSINLKYFMRKNHVSRITISSMMDVPYTTVTSWVKGDNYPRIKRIDQLAAILSVSKSDLIEPLVGTKLHEIRKHQHIGIDPLAARSGVSGSNISRIEQNKIQPKLATLMKLAKGLRISKGRMYQIAGVMPSRIYLFNVFKCRNVSWRGHPLDKDDYQMFKLWFKNKYGK